MGEDATILECSVQVGTGRNGSGRKGEDRTGADWMRDVWSGYERQDRRGAVWIPADGTVESRFGSAGMA